MDQYDDAMVATNDSLRAQLAAAYATIAELREEISRKYHMVQNGLHKIATLRGLLRQALTYLDFHGAPSEKRIRTRIDAELAKEK